VIIFKSSSSGFANQTRSYPSWKYPAAVSAPKKIYKNRKISTSTDAEKNVLIVAYLDF
jgi:hypothetical protein